MPEVLAPGTVIDRYRISGDIGSGSMGDVLRGEDVDLKRQVAVKILSERHRENKELRARFVREARAVAAISHPNVVQVFTTGTWDDRPYIAMELLVGVDLGSVVKEQGVMTSIQAARAVLDAARGLEAAAKAGLIHRDVKPSNLVLLESGQVKVTDFGLAKPLDPSSEPALTAMGVVVGTPDYIAPEQARGEPIDERVDIYALGGTLYYLLAGIPPYRKGNPVDDKYLKVVARHLKDPVPSARTRNKGADRELARLGKQMMAKKPTERPGYPELLEQLAAIIVRLEKGGASASLPAVSADRTPRNPAPTPFVGGSSRPHRISSSGPYDAAHYDQGPQRRGRGSTPPIERAPIERGHHDDEAAATLVRASSSRSTQTPPGPSSRWLVVVTILCVAVFATGLGLMLLGPMPAPPAAAGTGLDAGATLAPPADSAAAPEPIEVPKGMILVRRASGEPWFFTDAAPVTHAEYAALFPNRKQPIRGARARRPVTSVRFRYAESFAEAVGKRLLTPEEWAAAAAAEGFIPAEDRWEWVADGSEGSQARQSVRKLPAEIEQRRPVGHADVTFRCGRNLEIE